MAARGSAYKESETTPQQVAYRRARFAAQDDSLLSEEAQWGGLEEGEAPSSEEVVLGKEEVIILYERLGELPEGMRGPIEAYFLEGESLETYAAEHSMTRQRAFDGMMKGLNALRWRMTRGT